VIDGYAPEEFYICPLIVISSCPDYFMGWKIESECANGPIEYIYHEMMTFRNPACAVCCSLEPSQIFELSLQSGDMKTSTAELIQTLEGLRNISRPQQFSVDLNMNRCCRSCPGGNMICEPLTMTHWGAVMNPTTQRCQSIPFDTDCNNPPTNESKAVDWADLCPHITCPEPSTIHTPTIVPIWGSSVTIGFRTSDVWWDGPGGNREPPAAILPTDLTTGPILAGIFGNVPAFMVTDIVKTGWVGDNSTYLLCGNGSIRNPLTGINYKTLQLHQGDVKVSHNYVTGR